MIVKNIVGQVQIENPTKKVVDQQTDRTLNNFLEALQDRDDTFLSALNSEEIEQRLAEYAVQRPVPFEIVMDKYLNPDSPVNLIDTFELNNLPPYAREAYLYDLAQRTCKMEGKKDSIKRLQEVAYWTTTAVSVGASFFSGPVATTVAGGSGILSTAIEAKIQNQNYETALNLLDDALTEILKNNSGNTQAGTYQEFIKKLKNNSETYHEGNISREETILNIGQDMPDLLGSIPATKIVPLVRVLHEVSKYIDTQYCSPDKINHMKNHISNNPDLPKSPIVETPVSKPSPVGIPMMPNEKDSSPGRNLNINFSLSQERLWLERGLENKKPECKNFFYTIFNDDAKIKDFQDSIKSGNCPWFSANQILEFNEKCL